MRLKLSEDHPLLNDPLQMLLDQNVAELGVLFKQSVWLAKYLHHCTIFNPFCVRFWSFTNGIMLLNIDLFQTPQRVPDRWGLHSLLRR